MDGNDSKYEEFQGNVRIDLFFSKLLTIKADLLLNSIENPDKNVALFARQIYEQLNELYKTQEEYEKSLSDSSSNS